MISTQLVNSNYNIIDRSQITRILQEQQYNKYTDKQIIDAFRKNNPQYNNKGDIWVIKYIEKKAKK